MGITQILNMDGGYYMDLASAMKEIRKHRRQLSTQQIRTLKGQVLSGDIEAAMKGLFKLKNRSTMGGDN